MKHKKNPQDRFQRDKYADGPKKPPKLKAPRSTWDDENLDDALGEWLEMRSARGEEE